MISFYMYILFYFIPPLNLCKAFNWMPLLGIENPNHCRECVKRLLEKNVGKLKRWWDT